jgi:hypothetical protein
MRFQNVFTGDKVTVKKISTRKDCIFGEQACVDYVKDHASPAEKSKDGEIVRAGFTENLKPLYVFEQCYEKI